MPRFVLEIGTEEMPARFFPRLNKELGQALEKQLGKARLEYSSVSTLATPRRMAAMVDGLSATQPVEEELVSGPPERVAFDKDGKPTKAALGFAKTQGVDVADAFVQETEKGRYLAVKKTVGGGTALELLPAICAKVIKSLQFPKRMTWSDGDFGFGRPLGWILALLDDDVVEFSLAGLESGRGTRGHRVMGPGPFDVAHADDYLDVIRDKGRVVPGQDERREIIRSQGDALAAEVGGEVVWNESLLDEVVGLVEYPSPILGRFDPSFLEVPREVLLTSMESHQKSFGVAGPDGALLPCFISTLNIEPKDRELVRKGWERVLRARLEDARFFWKSDLAKSFDDWLDDLDKVIFIGPLGSMGDKSRRMERLAAWIARAVDPSLEAEAARAGRLAKADLVSEMVGEFDELQGMMGGIYATHRGESVTVAKAMYEHYLPEGPSSPVPATKVGAFTAMADKADTLLGCFGLGMIPTGANDPNALRRQSLGICRTIMDQGLRLNLMDLLAEAQEGYQGVNWKLPPEEAMEKLADFVGGRLKVFFTGKGYDTLVVEAALGAGFDDVWALSARIQALAEFSRSDDFEQAVLTFKRTANIIVKQAGELGGVLDGNYDPALLEEDQEKALAARLEETSGTWDELWAADDFPRLLGLLRELRPAVDAFFDHVMVMCEDKTLRTNRLNLLKALVSRLGRLADFSALQI